MGQARPTKRKTKIRLDELYLWYLGTPTTPRYVGALKLVAAGKGVSLHYGNEWLTSGFALSEDLPLVDIKFFNSEPVDAPLIEHATMTLAKRAGITVAETQLIRLAGANAIAVLDTQHPCGLALAIRLRLRQLFVASSLKLSQNPHRHWLCGFFCLKPLQ